MFNFSWQFLFNPVATSAKTMADYVHPTISGDIITVPKTDKYSFDDRNRPF